MIRLNNTPNEGSAVKVNLGFRDSAGQYYIPAKITYTLLALNDNKENWRVVDDLYQVPITPASSVTLTIPDMKIIEGTTLSRMIEISWDAFVDNQYTTFTDNITFDVAPRPYIVDPPAPHPQPTVYVDVSSASLQIGALTAAPVLPVFIIKTNLPVNIDNAVCNITGGDLIVPCNITLDNTKGVLTINTDLSLNYLSSYKLTLEGLVSTINGYVMKEPFVLDFVTCREDTPPYIPVIEANKEVTITENGTTVVEADENFDAMKEVTVNVELPIQRSKTIEVTENGRHEIRPDAEFIAIDHGFIEVNVPAGGKPEQSKELTITENGTSTILPDTGYALSSVSLNVDVPVPEIEGPRNVDVLSNGTMEIKPAIGYDAIEKVNLHIAVPGAKEEQEKSVTITENGTTSVTPDENKALSKVDITVDVFVPELESNKEQSIDVTEYTDPIEITPSTDKNAMEKVTVTLTNIPTIESNKEQTIDVSSYSSPVEILPDSADGMAKTTVTLSNIPSLEENKEVTLDSNGEHEILPSTNKDAMEKVTVTVAVPLEANKEVSVDCEDYTDPIEITPTTGNDGMEKATVTLTNMTRLYTWKDANASPNPHYMYTTYSSTSKSNGHAYQCGTVKNALLTQKNVEVNGEALYVSGYPSSLYYRDPDNDIQH